MTCDNCGKERPLITVHIKTGKRGRPPKKQYCQECIEAEDVIVPSIEKAVKEIKQADPANKKPERRSHKPKVERHIDGFNPAALFLLDLAYENLFELSSGDEYHFRCKGCSALVVRIERQDHWREHKGL